MNENWIKFIHFVDENKLLVICITIIIVACIIADSIKRIRE